MKAKIFTRIAVIVLLAALFTGSIRAQQQVLAGSTYNYTTGSTVTGSTYVWTVSGGATGFTNSGTSSQNITWGSTAGDYTISVYAINNSCNGNTQTFAVHVNAAGTLAFSTTPVSNQCSLTTGTDVNIDVVATGTLVYPIDIQFTVKVGAGAAQTRTQTLNASTDRLLVAGATDNIGYNSSNSTDLVSVITLTSATSHGKSVLGASNLTFTYTAYATPATDVITAH